MKTWHNGKLIDGKPVIDSMNWTLHYSGSVWEGIRSYVLPSQNYKLLKLNEHIARLFESAKILKMEIPFSAQTLVQACHEVVKANGGATSSLLHNRFSFKEGFKKEANTPGFSNS